MDQAARWRAGWRPDEDISIPRNAHWLKDLREQRPWQGKGLVVLSMFDGIGGVWQALKDLGIPVLRGYSCEVNDFANSVVKACFPEVIHLGSVTAVTKESIPEEQVDLIVGGFPCQDLSFMGNQRGLHGSRSGLFFHIPRLIKLFQAKWFLVENVKCRWQDQAEVSKYLEGVLPIEIDAEELSPQSRKRYYWTNLPLPSNLPGIKDAPETALDYFVQGAVVPVAKINTILTTNNAANTSRVALQCVYDVARGRARYVTVDEVEAMMGYPHGHSDIPDAGKFKFFHKKSPKPSKRQNKEHIAGRQLFVEKAERSAEPPQKKLKLDGTKESGLETERGNESEGKSKVRTTDARVFINLSSDEEEEKAEGETAVKERQEELGSVSEEERTEAPQLDASDPARTASAAEASLQNEAGGSGLSIEEKANKGGETKSPGYAFRARKSVDYNVDRQFDNKYQIVPRKKSTPRRSRASLTPQEMSLQRLKELRWACLGNSFVVPCVSYMLSPLLNTAMRLRAERITSIPDPAEKDACLFEPGEVWALYNDDVAPNWYGQISEVEVTCPQWDGRKKTPRKVTVRYCFYEYPDANDAGVGTGVLELSKTPHADDSIAFSHRMEPVHLGGGRILVYPKGGDVWVVKDKLIPRFKMHVYIVDSSVDEAAGSFVCTIRDLRLQPRSTNSCTFYRMVGPERRVSSAESVFSYQVPYFYKNEAGLLYVEPQTDTSQKRIKRQSMMEDDEPALAEEEDLEEEEAGLEETAELQHDLEPGRVAGLAAFAKSDPQDPQPTEGQQKLEPDPPEPSSSNGKETFDYSSALSEEDDYAGILPREEGRFMEQRSAVKWRYVDHLMDSLPVLPPRLR